MSAVVRLDEDIGTLVVKGATFVVKRHPVKVGFWVIGLLIAIMGSGYVPSLDSLDRYESRMESVDLEALYDAEEFYWQANQAYRRSQGFLWSCDPVCQQNKGMAAEAYNVVQKLRRETSDGIKRAKQEVGLFSTYGVGEAKDLFWSKAAGGQRYAKRATMWDALFAGIGAMGRDEGLTEWVIRVFFHLLMNLTVGIIGALIGFLWSVWSIITSYNADPLSATAFYACALLGSVSLAATWIMGLLGVGAGSVLLIAKAAASSARIQAEERRRYLQQQGSGSRMHRD